jgi:hypothetical protein
MSEWSERIDLRRAEWGDACTLDRRCVDQPDACEGEDKPRMNHDLWEAEVGDTHSRQCDDPPSVYVPTWAAAHSVSTMEAVTV